MKRLVAIFILIVGMSMMAFAQDPAVSQESGKAKSGYGHDGAAEVFVTGFGLLPHQTTGNAINEQGTKAGGGSAGYRFHLSSSSALEGRYGFSRISQKYTIAGAISSIPVYLSEISGSYVYSFGKSRNVQPFLEGGGGLVLFSPGNYGGAATTATNPFGYGVTDLTGTTVSSYGGSSGLPRQAKG